MSFIDKYYTIFNNSVGQHNVSISRAEFANLLGVFSKQEQQLDQFKAENERLEAHSATLDAIIETGKVQYKALKQTLTEIKEIAETAVNFCEDCGGEDYECIDCTNGGRAQISKEILQKISEVEDEN